MSLLKSWFSLWEQSFVRFSSVEKRIWIWSRKMQRHGSLSISRVGSHWEKRSKANILAIFVLNKIAGKLQIKRDWWKAAAWHCLQSTGFFCNYHATNGPIPLSPSLNCERCSNFSSEFVCKPSCTNVHPTTGSCIPFNLQSRLFAIVKASVPHERTVARRKCSHDSKEKIT